MNSWLECDGCGSRASRLSLSALCQLCGGQLSVHYPPGADLAASGPGIFRFGRRLPVDEPESAVSLGEGDTPLVNLGGPAATGLGVVSALAKCESMNPTGSFKDRIAAVAATIMRERGIPGCIGTSSGNGGAAMASYARRAGKELVVFALAETPPEKLLQIRAAGGQVVLLKGLGYDSAVTSQATGEIVHHASSHGLMTVITASRFAPEPMEGLKTIAYELAEQVPDTTVVYVPVGGGGLFSAIWRGYKEIADGLPHGVPRLVAVQPLGCPTIRNALRGGSHVLPAAATTAISGLQVAVLFDAPGVKSALDGSQGHLVEVSDEEVFSAQRVLADQEGLLVEPAGATAFAGALKDSSAGRLGPEDRVVVLATGAGYKDAGALGRLATASPLEECRVDGIGDIVKRIRGAFTGLGT